MDPIMIDLGFIAIHWYSFFIFLAILVGGALAIIEGKKFNINDETMTNIIFYTVVLGILGARIYYVLFNFSYYKENLFDIFKIWEGGLAIHGGIIFAGLFLIIYVKKKYIKPFRILDIMAVSLIIAQAIGRWGNFFNQEAHGPAVEKSVLDGWMIPNFIVKGMHINNAYYHPTFLYESLYNVVGFIILLILRKKKKLKLGIITCAYAIWYGVGRYFIEGLRTDSLMLGDMKVAQLVSIGLIIVGVLGSIFINYNKASYLYNRKVLNNE